MKLLRKSLHVVATFGFLSLAAGNAAAQSFQRLSPEGGVGNVELKHLKMNAAGDYVAVSRAKVFVGNAASGPVTELTVADDIEFVLGEQKSFVVGTQQVMIDTEILDTRVAINGQGDFVLASNTRVWVGNTRTKAIRQAGSSGPYSQIQSVAINDAGFYVAMADEKVLGGNVQTEQATVLLEEAVGTFSIYSLFSEMAQQVQTVSGEQRLALNAAGQFLVITQSAVYQGDLRTLTMASLYEERYLGFRHVALNDAGAFVVVAERDVFGGSLAAR